MGTILVTAVCVFGAFGSHLSARDFDKRPSDEFSAVVDRLARNQVSLRHFCWNARTEVSVNGQITKTSEDLSRYGPDGTVYKTPVGTPVLRDENQGLRRRAVEVKTDEIEDYIRAAVLLTNNYVAPLPERMQNLFAAANGPLLKKQGSDEIQVQLRDLVKPRDVVAFSFGSEDKSIRAIDVTSYLEDQADVVTLHVAFDSLPDGTKHAASSILIETARQIQIKTQNLNYRKVWQ